MRLLIWPLAAYRIWQAWHETPFQRYQRALRRLGLEARYAAEQLTAYQRAVLDAGPVGYWTLDE